MPHPCPSCVHTSPRTILPRSPWPNRTRRRPRGSRERPNLRVKAWDARSTLLRLYTSNSHHLPPRFCRLKPIGAVVGRRGSGTSSRCRVACGARAPEGWRPRAAAGRSEEHTSELQSLTNLVCRLLLEKKKKKTPTIGIG